MDDFDKYTRQGEPSQKAKVQAWETAIGLQQTDGLKTSRYLVDVARQNIEGDITIDEVKERLNTYYQTQATTAVDDRTEEADKVAARITEILGEQTFSFTPAEYINIHRRLFTGIYSFAGKIRNYNITKEEWVLDGATVYYSSWELIREALEHDFGTEKNFNYKDLSAQEKIRHVTKFLSDIWQVHAFGEGNTRSTAVFAIKYLRTLGFNPSVEPFAKHSWYFRNALVRANYNDYTADIHASTEYLDRFFGNLLLNENNTLQNRDLHIKNTPNMLGVNDTQKLGVKLSTNQIRLINLLTSNPKLTIKDLATMLELSDTAILNNLNKLRTHDLIQRVGSDKTGHWQVKS